MKYRPDMDGLRAISVAAVIGFHAFPAIVPGGFIGVDVFFVISGFLISGLIFDELMDGRFSFIGFYARRVRRIFPALLVVMAACLVFGWFALFSDEYRLLGEHTAGASAFVVNALLWNETGYFAPAAASRPLLHLWSLAIEEQFYVLWPLIVVLAWRRLPILLVAIGLTSISFALNVSRVGADQAEAFYILHTRFWELLSGGVLLYMAWSGWRLSGAPRELAGLVGLGLIVYAAFGITDLVFYPGWEALLPVGVRAGWGRHVAAELKARFPRLIVFDPMNTLCGPHTCGLTRDGKFLYADDNHLSDYGSAVARHGTSYFAATWFTLSRFATWL